MANSTDSSGYGYGNGNVAGSGELPAIDLASVRTYDFGGISMADQLLKQTGLDRSMEELIPESSDTLKALVGYRLLESDSVGYAADWYPKSFASVMYPDAGMEPQLISEFHGKLGIQ
ncbi:MAG: hypothetical protein LBR80_04890 [Deltaproteobacteria bacterium]|jgi:hypothetical protein|nr:hypothetical protein [Deltaproteobacteria bacterium]